MNLESSRPAWIEIDLKALKMNYNKIRDKVKDKKIAAVVKADAYGHGAVKIAQKLSEFGTDYFCVGSPDEGLELREAGIKKPILVLAEVLENQYQEIIDANLIQTVGSLKTLTGLNKIAAKNNTVQSVHLKLDTGMGRIGFLENNIIEAFEKASKLRHIRIEALFSHLARADEKNKDYSFQQLDKFKRIIKKLESLGYNIPLKHIANSAAIIDLPQFIMDMVRPGIMIYGLEPSGNLKNSMDLQSLLSFKTKIVEIRSLAAGSAISYGSDYITKKKEKLAVLPVGYKDGYPRILSNKADVLINGQRAPIRGKICMGQTIVSVDHIKDVKIGDEVVLIGKQKKEEITASEIADLAQTINYEIVCNLSERLEKIYI